VKTREKNQKQIELRPGNRTRMHQVAGTSEQVHLSRRERAAIVLQKQFRVVQARRVLKSKALNLAWDLIEYYDGTSPQGRA
jgi:hypothetical protein